jgi:hypothetical protein
MSGILFWVHFFHGPTAIVGLSLLIIAVSRSHSDIPHSARLLWTSDRPVAGTSHKTNSCPPRDSNPQSQQERSTRSMPYTVRPLGSALRLVMTDEFNVDLIAVGNQGNVMIDRVKINYVLYYTAKIASSNKK